MGLSSGGRVVRDARYWIERLGLVRHPEGGWFKETFRSSVVLPALGAPYDGVRVASTDIYFLLEAHDVSHLHRLASEERWHFHIGGAMTVYAIFPDGTRHDLRLGPNPERGEHFQVGVPAGSVFGARVDATEDPERAFSLVSCTVAPGFEFADFELCDRGELLARYPGHRQLIDELARRE
jgi:predicted cupin superfamily sugar epimerase